MTVRRVALLAGLTAATGPDGAWARSPVFFGGFEAGDTGAWSGSVP